MDLHDFDLEPDGTALITVYEPVHANLSAAGGPANGIIEDCVVQEIDVKTGLVMWEWHALGHVPLSASYSKPYPSSSAVWDWFHINSIDRIPDGNLLISSRNTWAVYEIGHTYGEVIWRLGGRNSSLRARERRALRVAARRDAPFQRHGRDLRQRGHPTDRQAVAGHRRRPEPDQAHGHAPAPVRQPQQVGALAEPGRRAAARQRRQGRRLGPDRARVGVLRRRAPSPSS